MLRAVLIDDPDTFAITLDWAEKNLKRLDPKGKAVDQLWAWKWGKEQGKWGPIDKNFASDADIDAVYSSDFGIPSLESRQIIWI